MNQIRVSDEPIFVEQALNGFGHDAHGAQTVFTGVVRENNHGRKVVSVSYDAFIPLAEATLREIVSEARKKWGEALLFKVVHRTGCLEVGEVSVLIAVSSPHRDEAYQASRYVIEQIKVRAPIWKKETYTDGESEWLKGHALCSHTDRYSRQERLPEVGHTGQEKLSHSRVLCIGAGGLGSPSLLYLASAGIGEIGIVDGDDVEISNLQRQVLFTSGDSGRNKAEVAAQRLRELNPDVKVKSFPVNLDPSNVLELFRNYDLILDGTDNFTAKYLINDAATKLGIPWVYATVTGFEAQVAVFSSNGGPCYRCLYPKPPRRDVGSCTENGVLGAWVGVIGSSQALSGIQHLLGFADQGLGIFDGKSGHTSRLQMQKRADCPVCQGPASEIVISRTPRFQKVEGTFTWIDVRSEEEWATNHPTHSLHWPITRLEGGTFPDLPRDRLLRVYCASGARAKRASEILKTQGFMNVEVGSLREAEAAQGDEGNFT
jgi:adenylyltransferase/sulfurtransferase